MELINPTVADVLETAIAIHNGDDTVNPLQNRDGWVNPEDIAPMPQCIAQQNPSTWLNAMTRCTRKRCVSYFLFICTHSQWLTQLDCLANEFSSDVVREYLPYCGRSVLAKAQLYNWVRDITHRTWLVDYGDADGLESLSRSSLADGYASVTTVRNAPRCLKGSRSSSPSMEPFEFVISSCGFTGSTQTIGDPTRLWEYSEPLNSMTALGYDTAGYDLIKRFRYDPFGSSLSYGDYYDRTCFCDAFTMSAEPEPCSDPRQLDFTRERVWMNAICGPASVPNTTSDLVRITGPAYMHTDDWRWPQCFADMPKQVTKRVDQCTTDACEVDSTRSGYCHVKRTVDINCFCRDVSYDSCGGSCHDFYPTRMEYATWLHNLCGNVKGWHGLPQDWREMVALTRSDMIPWRWAVNPRGECAVNDPLNDWKLGSLILINIATLLSAFLSWDTGIYRITRGFMSRPQSSYWFFKGFFIAGLHVLASRFNALLVLRTLGYELVPSSQLILLWCTMPRPGWLPILQIVVQPFKDMDISAVASSLLAETILQALSSYYMLMTIKYGFELGFYQGYLQATGMELPAQAMYFGALLWLVAVCVLFFQFVRAVFMADTLLAYGNANMQNWQRSDRTASNIEEEVIYQFWLHWRDSDSAVEERTPLRGERRSQVVYGTVSVHRRERRQTPTPVAQLYAPTALGMLLLWAAQWLFWGGFIALSLEEYVSS